MDLNEYFDPVSLPKPLVRNVHAKDEFGKRVTVHTPDTPVAGIEAFDMALLSVPEERRSRNKGSFEAPDHIRQKLYSLGRLRNAVNIIDLGNMRTGASPQDTFFGLRDIIFHLLENDVIPVIMGGTQDITLAGYEAVMKYRGRCRLLNVDARLDLAKGEKEITADSWMEEILKDKRKGAGLVTLGHQEYLVSLADLDKLEKKGYHAYRLGRIRENPSYYEPLFRDAEIHSFDLAAVRQGDAPGTLNPSPNGFSGNEICQMALFSGLSDHVSAFFITEANPRLDERDQTTHLAAQMIWFFSHGLAQRSREIPDPADENFTQFIIDLTESGHEITFLKSNRTDRWWFLSPVPEKKKDNAKEIREAIEDGEIDSTEARRITMRIATFVDVLRDLEFWVRGGEQ